MSDLTIPYEHQLLTANGSATGLLTVASTAKFRKNARVWLRDNNSDGIELIIDAIVDNTTLYVRNPALIGTLRFDATAYTTAQSATLYQNEQMDFYGRNKTWF